MLAALISGKHETIIFAFLMTKKCKCEKALDCRNPTRLFTVLLAEILRDLAIKEERAFFRSFLKIVAF